MLAYAFRSWLYYAMLLHVCMECVRAAAIYGGLYLSVTCVFPYALRSIGRNSPSAPTGVCVRAGFWAEPQQGLGRSPSRVWGRAPAGVRGGKPRRGSGRSPEENCTRQAPTGRFLLKLDGLVHVCGQIDMDLHELRFCCSRCTQTVSESTGEDSHMLS